MRGGGGLFEPGCLIGERSEVLNHDYVVARILKVGLLYRVKTECPSVIRENLKFSSVLK